MGKVFWKTILAAVFLSTPAVAEGNGEQLPGGLGLSGHPDLDSRIEAFEREINRFDLDRNSLIARRNITGRGNGLRGLGLFGMSDTQLKHALLQDYGLKALPQFQLDGEYYQDHVDQPEYFTGDKRLSFLGEDEALFRDLTPHIPCPYCVFLGQEPSAIEAAAVLKEASMASAPIGFFRPINESCPLNFGSLNFLVQSLDECLLPVVALTISSNNGKKNKVVCSGTIVGPNYVLTAAHCACRGITDVFFGTAVPQFNVGLDWRSSNDSDGFDKFYGENKQIALFAKRRAVQGAPIYFGDEKMLCDAFAKSKAIPPKLVPYDIALLPLSSNLFALGEQNQFSQTAIASFPALGSFLLNQADVLIAGFGPDGNVRARQVVKRYARSKVRNISDDKINVGAKGRHVSTCSGDSGSGVYSVEGGRLVIHGVLSNGMSDCTTENPVSNFAYIGLGSEAHTWLSTELSK